MKSINAKRIAAIAASLIVGLAFAGPVSFQNVPIINNAGQPVVQIVVGSTAAPSDGVVAANIAAVIGNLAYTSTPITATVNGKNAVSCAVTTPTCTLSNQQVWLGEKGVVVPTGSYKISTLIGSIMNGGVLNYNTLSYTKTLDNTGLYSYPEGSSPYPISTSPTASVFTGITSYNPIPVNNSVTAGTNGGGMSFSQFSSYNSIASPATYYDNIVELSNVQVPGLMSSSGPNSESEYLWLMGFPVYDQALNNFALLDANGAYQVTFGTPVPLYSGTTSAYKQITFLGENWTIYGGTPPTVSTYPTSNTYVVGGKLELAQSITPQETVYVGHNITSGPITVVLQDLSYPNSSGGSKAAIAVYNKGVLTNETAIPPYTIYPINSSGTTMYVSVGETFPGLYAYQKWAKIQLFSNVFNITSFKNFNSNNNNWLAAIRWTTNQSTAPSAWGSNTLPNYAEVQGIILYSNSSKSQTMTPGSTFSFIQNPVVWKLNFLGDSLGAPGSGNSNYDPISFSTTTSTAGTTYQNPVSSPSGKTLSEAWNGLAFVTGPYMYWGNTTAITEPTSQFTVSSSVPTAFTVIPPAGKPAPSSSMGSVTYNLDTYELTQKAVVESNTLTASNGASNPGLVVVLNPGLDANYITSANPLTVKITGYKGGVLSSGGTVQFTSGSGSGLVQTTSQVLDNITNIQLSYPLPAPGVSVSVYETPNTLDLAGANVLMATLSYDSNGPTVMYSVPTYNYLISAPVGTTTVDYGEESGAQVPFTLTANVPTTTQTAPHQYFTYNMPEITLPSTTTPNAYVYLGLMNQSSVADPTPLYWLNQTNGDNNALVYTSSQGNSVKAVQGFRTERGSEVAAISPTSVTYDMAKAVDALNFVVGPSSSGVSSTTKTYGPYGIGQATNIPNVTIANVSASCSFSSTSCTVTGLSNLTATPSVTSATTPVTLNTATTPLAVLDSNANQAATLIVVGSKYVNSVAAQIFTQNPSLDSSFGPGSVIVQAFGTNRILVAGYTANQTVTAGNEFIQDLLTAAGQ